MTVVVLVEGVSDQLALEAVARRSDIELAASGVEVRAVGGITNFGRHLREGAQSGVVMLGLCDAAERRVVRRALGTAGITVGSDPDELIAAGFFVCDVDLEDEFLRALGPEGAQDFFDSLGDLESFRMLQQMPAQRDRTLHQQLRRFFSSRGGRKIQYAPAIVQRLDLDQIPAPLTAVLQRAIAAADEVTPDTSRPPDGPR